MANRSLENQRSTGTIISLSRRFAHVRLDTPADSPIRCHILNKFNHLTLGDRVVIEPEQEGYEVKGQLERKNCLLRSYFGKTKQIAANVDHLFIVTAPEPLFNTYFIDRALVSAFSEEIPVSLIINKADLMTSDTKKVLCIYDEFTDHIFFTEAKAAVGIEELRNYLNFSAPTLVVFSGVSGVGKSTILNALIPGAAQRTAQVSRKTGQGKQTTSQALAHALVFDSSTAPVLVVDTPGLQHFGLTHLSKGEVRDAFLDLAAFQAHCRFQNCSHLQEEECGVKKALQEGTLAYSRYESYMHIIDELERAKLY
jgi:ribosome biogenesis GTPase / thiamine phosphate phosphatase